jgi:glycosyltransferase involved in cell wall biosynthesis
MTLNTPMLTVLMATRNRDRLLRDVLEGYCSLQAPPSGWQMVVVDNGSTDQTSDVLASFANRLPLRTVPESRLGKNFALNTGLQLAQGDLIVFTDDDAFPHPDWLSQLRKAADENLDCSMFGGVVLPRWESSPPHWIGWVNQGAVYTLTDPSLRNGPLDPKEIYGPNMAIRASALSSGTRFDTTIGPSGSSYPMGSETELVLRLGQQGLRAWHVQGAVVEHFIRKEQLKKAWVLERAIRFGRGQYRLYKSDAENEGLRWKGVPLRLYRKMLKQAILVMLGWMTFRSESRFRAHWRLNVFRGEAVEASILAHQRKAQAQMTPVGTKI